MPFTVEMPHWLTGLIGVVGTACGALAAANTFPAETGVLAGIAAISVFLATPTLKTKSKVAS